MNNNIQCSIESSTTSMELNSAADGIFLVPELEGLAGLPEIRTTSGVNAGYDGGWTSAQNYDARLIAIRGVIANKDIATVEATRRKLASLLGQGRKEQLTLRFTTEAGNAYTISVRTISCEMALQRVLNKQDFLIQLRADDPLIYDDGASGGTEAILRVQQALGGFEINFGLPLAIGGSSDATAVENGAETVYPIIKLYGPLHSPTVVNMTTNQQMQIIADLGYTINWSGWTGVSGERLAIPNELDKEAPLRFWSVDGNTTQDGTPPPSAPVPVQTVTGRQTVGVTGKNLYDPNSTVFSLPSVVSVSVDGDTVTATALETTTSNGLFWRTPIPDSMLENGKDYTASCVLGSGAYRSLRLQLRNHDGSNAGFSNNFTVTYDDRYTLFVVENPFATTASTTITAGTTCTISNIQVEEGSTATTFEPYEGQDYEINLGKNLWGGFASDFTKTLGGITFVTKTDGTITNTAGTTSATAYSAFASEATSNGLTKTLEAGTYCISGASGNITLDVCDTSGTTLVTDSGNGATFTLSAQKTVFVRIRVASGKTLTAGTTKPQLEKGSQATDYSAYFEPIELCKIGTHQDRIYKENGKWWLHKETGKTVADTSAMTLIGNYSNIEYATTAKPSDFAGYGNYQNIGVLCSHATYQDGGDSAFWNQSNNAGHIYTRADNRVFWVGFAKGTGLDAIKTALANCIIYYPLATPITTEITNEEVLEGLEALGDATLYVGTNNIYTDTPSALPTLEVDYPTDYDEIHDTVIIDSQARTITLNGADIYHLKTEESEFPVLAPGENRMYLTSATTSDAGYAEVKFKQGYLSI